VLQRILKKKTSVGAAAHRGTSVETGVAHGLTSKAALRDCQSKAMDQFKTLTAMTTDPRADKEAGGVPEMVMMGMGELLPYGAPSSVQGLLEYRFDDIAVPMIGYYDFEWEKRGLIIDLKTTWALPSEIKINHARQIAFYCAAKSGKADTNIDGRVTYVTPKKVATYRLENVKGHILALNKIAATIQRFVALSKDPMELAGLVVPDIDSFYFNDPVTRQMAFEVWGI
jgi:hypothetical protein